MADQLSAEAVSMVQCAVTKAFSESSTPLEGLQQLINHLRGQSEGVLTGDGLDKTAAALAVLATPREARLPWASAPPDRHRGLFLVFEGLDRSGKSTQSRGLAKRLEEKGDARWMCFPDRKLASGILIDMYLRRMIEMPDDAIHLLFSANRWEVAPLIVEQLNCGISVICDRYAFSGVAYSAAKGLGFEWCQEPDVGLPVPDCVFFLHLNPEVGKSRSNFGDERYENVDMQARVREEFARPQLHAGVEWCALDAAREIEDIGKEISAVVQRIAVEDRENHRPVCQLWL